MTINCKGKLIDVSTPKVMGILNITPDSFYDGGKHNNVGSVLKTVERMITDGATFVDVGAYSSKPNVDEISETEELKRITPVITALVEAFPELVISIDTFRSQVAKTCVEAGASIVNDISAGRLDPEMLQTVAQLQVPYIMMHMRGTPQTMQLQTDYTDILKDMLFYFSERINEAHAFGINDIIVDPGFGFAKTVAQNFEVLKDLNYFSILEKPLLAGLSRKSMIYKTLGTTPEFALNGTTALNTIALQQGAKILRVHDVKEAVECVHLYNQLHA